jgi:hypothetical protein
MTVKSTLEDGSDKILFESATIYLFYFTLHRSCVHAGDPTVSAISDGGSPGTATSKHPPERTSVQL